MTDQIRMAQWPAGDPQDAKGMDDALMNQWRSGNQNETTDLHGQALPVHQFEFLQSEVTRLQSELADHQHGADEEARAGDSARDEVRRLNEAYLNARGSLAEARENVNKLIEENDSLRRQLGKWQRYFETSALAEARLREKVAEQDEEAVELERLVLNCDREMKRLQALVEVQQGVVEAAREIRDCRGETMRTWDGHNALRRALDQATTPPSTTDPVIDGPRAVAKLNKATGQWECLTCGGVFAEGHIHILKAERLGLGDR